MADTESGNGEKLRSLIVDKASFLADNDLYSLLGIPAGSGAADIRDAYFRLAKLLHPDAIAKAGIPDVQPQGIEVFKGLANAYRILSDPRKKAEYDSVWAKAAGVNQTPTEVRTRKDAQAEARMFFHKGTLMIKRLVWEEAVASLRKAVELDPGNVEYLVALGWAVMQNEKVPLGRRLEEARGWFEQAVHSEAPTADAYYHLSLYYKAVNDASKQRLALQDALTLDPKHVGAQRERRLMNIRQKNQSQQKDLFASVTRFIEKLKTKKL